MEQAKIRIKLGGFELEFEGSQSFVDERLTDFVASLSQHLEIEPIKSAINEPIEEAPSIDQGKVSSSLTTSTVAAHTGVSGAHDLILAAIAKLQIVDGRDRAKRADILKEMQSATSYYSENARKHLSRDLSRMVKAKKLNQIASGEFSLPASVRDDLSKKIAAIK